MSFSRRLTPSRSVDSERFPASASLVTDVPSQLSGDCEFPTEFLVLEWLPKQGE